MYKGFNDTIKKETIVLSNLQGGNENSGLADLLHGKNDYFISNPNENSMKFSNISFMNNIKNSNKIYK